MNATLRIIAPLLAMAGLAACASTQSSVASSPPSGMERATVVRTTMATDGEYVARVEQIARRRGILVQWVNPPIKRTTVRQ